MHHWTNIYVRWFLWVCMNPRIEPNLNLWNKVNTFFWKRVYMYYVCTISWSCFLCLGLDFIVTVPFLAQIIACNLKNSEFLLFNKSVISQIYVIMSVIRHDRTRFLSLYVETFAFYTVLNETEFRKKMWWIHDFLSSFYIIFKRYQGFWNIQI